MEEKNNISSAISGFFIEIIRRINFKKRQNPQ